jgi:hypothetical protein
MKKCEVNKKKYELAFVFSPFFSTIFLVFKHTNISGFPLLNTPALATIPVHFVGPQSFLNLLDFYMI